MPGRIEKTIFISYRRTNMPWALAIYQNLTARGYDAFFDFQSINSGDFEQIIAGNIRARAHFLVILTPSALERCIDPNDWLRREIETALDEKRNIVPLFLEGFSIGSPSIAHYLTGKLALLKSYNGLNVPADYFDEAMDRLVRRFLNVPLDAVLHPVSNALQKAVDRQQTAASQAKTVEQQELSAQEWYEQGRKHIDAENHDKAIQCFSEAIRLAPTMAYAYYGRGFSHRRKGDYASSIKDFDEAIRLDPNYAESYAERGAASYDAGDYHGSLTDYEIYVQRNGINKKDAQDFLPTIKEKIKPEWTSEEWYAEGRKQIELGNYDEAIRCFSEAIRLSPAFAYAYYGRGFCLRRKGEFANALMDFDQAIRLEPAYAESYAERGATHFENGNYKASLKDYETYTSMNGQNKQGAQDFIRTIKEKLNQK
jgi:tetratricopeptide (TPR) repeat protein